MMNALQSLDQRWFLLLNAGPAAPGWLLALAWGLAEGLLYGLPLLLAVQWWRGDRQRRLLIARALAVLLLAFGLKLLIGALWPRLRPFELGLGSLRLDPPLGPSFPSGHATAFFAMGWALWRGGARGEGGAILLAGLGVAWARIYLGVHFPLDMLGAALLAWLAEATMVPLWCRYGEPMAGRYLKQDGSEGGPPAS